MPATSSSSQAVPILPDDTAVEVFRKVTVAAEMALHRCLPALIAGTAPHRPQDLSAGSYFGRRTARDGAIDWRAGARAAHNLIRAVAPPYPGAYTRGGRGGAAHPALAARGGAERARRSAARRSGAALVPGCALRALSRRRTARFWNSNSMATLRSAAAFHRRFGERALSLKPVME